MLVHQTSDVVDSLLLQLSGRVDASFIVQVLELSHNVHGQPLDGFEVHQCLFMLLSDVAGRRCKGPSVLDLSDKVAFHLNEVFELLVFKLKLLDLAS